MPTILGYIIYNGEFWGIFYLRFRVFWSTGSSRPSRPRPCAYLLSCATQLLTSDSLNCSQRGVGQYSVLQAAGRMAHRLTPVIRCLGLGHCNRSSPILSQIRVGSKQYSSVVKDEKVMTARVTDLDIPDVSLSKYIFDAQEKYGGYTALVSSRILTGVSHLRLMPSHPLHQNP